MKDFIEVVIDNIKLNGTFYTDISSNELKRALEMQYWPETIRQYGIDKVFCTADGFCAKWYKRPFILTDFELIKNYSELWFKTGQNEE